jgi:hypothetical protein
MLALRLHREWDCRSIPASSWPVATVKLFADDASVFDGVTKIPMRLTVASQRFLERSLSWTEYVLPGKTSKG